MTGDSCTLCRGVKGDEELGVDLVWEDELWRLTMARRGYTRAFGFLMPKRHIPHITDLDGPEASTFGAVLSRVTGALKRAADADLVYVYVFGGGIPHLHVHLAPHVEGDALNAMIIRGEVDIEELPSGAGRLVSREFPETPAAELAAVRERARALLST